MTNRLKRLELTWIGKEDRPRLEPRILLEDEELSYAKRVSKYDIFDNRLIHGDNLLALKALEQEFAGKVKCIYIDPPYNTGSAFEHYDDGVEHSIWLSLMRDRIVILRNLLSEDGSIWITLDDHESHYMKVLCDEIFGRENYRATITWQKKYSVSNNAKGLASITDFVLLYAKSPAFQNRLLPRSDEAKARYSNPDNDSRGPWKAVDYLNQATPSQRPNLCYDIRNPNTGAVIKNTKKAWKYATDVHQRHVAENRLWWGIDGTNTAPALKLFLSEVRDGMTPHNWWSHEDVGHTDEAKKEMIALFGAKDVFDTPKPERLIKRVLELATEPGDLVLDSFLGSGTTAAVAHKMGRRWIGIELGDHAITHCVPRLKKVVAGEDPGGITEAVAWKGGGGFRFFKLAPSLLEKDKWGTKPEEVAAAKATIEAIAKVVRDPQLAPTPKALQSDEVQKKLVEVVKDKLSGGQLTMYPDIGKLTDAQLVLVVREATAVYNALTIAIPRVIVLQRALTRGCAFECPFVGACAAEPFGACLRALDDAPSCGAFAWTIDDCTVCRCASACDR